MLGRRTQLPARRGGAPGGGRAAAGLTVRGACRVYARAAHAAPCKAGRRTRQRACGSGSRGRGAGRVCARAAHQAAGLQQRVQQRGLAPRRARGAVLRGLAPRKVCAAAAAGAAAAAAAPAAAAAAGRRRVLRQVREHRVPRGHQRVQRRVLHPAGRLLASAGWQRCLTEYPLLCAHSTQPELFTVCAHCMVLHTKQDFPCRPQGAAPCPGWTGLRASHGASAPAARSRGPEPGRAPGARRAPRAAPRAARRARPAGRAAQRGAPPRATPRGPGPQPARGTQRAGPALN